VPLSIHQDSVAMRYSVIVNYNTIAKSKPFLRVIAKLLPGLVEFDGSSALADKRRQLRGTEGHVVLGVEQQPVAVEAQAQGRIERRLVGGDLDRERVRRRPGPAGGDKGVRGHAQETVEAVREAVTTPRPRSEPDRGPRLAAGRAHEEHRRRRTEVERHG